MSLVRNFAYIFTTSEKARNFGLLSRLIAPTAVILSLSAPYVVPGVRISTVQTLAAIAYGAALLSYLAGPRRLVGMVKLAAMFILLGLFLEAVSIALGSQPSDPIAISLRALRMFSIVMTISSLFQLLSVSEIRYVLSRLGLGRYSELLSTAMAQLPVTFITFSEAYATAKLKLGERRVSALVKPLVVDAIVSSRYLAEALYMHGIPPAPRPKFLRLPNDLAVIVPAMIISLLSVEV